MSTRSSLAQGGLATALRLRSPALAVLLQSDAVLLTIGATMPRPLHTHTAITTMHHYMRARAATRLEALGPSELARYHRQTGALRCSAKSPPASAGLLTVGDIGTGSKWELDLSGNWI